MFPQFRKLNNESGMVFFAALMAVIVIMIYSLAILMQSNNEVSYAQQQIDQIVGEQLSKGIFWNSYSNGVMPNGTLTYTTNNRIYVVQSTAVANAVGPNHFNWNATTNYDTY